MFSLESCTKTVLTIKRRLSTGRYYYAFSRRQGCLSTIHIASSHFKKNGLEGFSCFHVMRGQRCFPITLPIIYCTYVLLAPKTEIAEKRFQRVTQFKELSVSLEDIRDCFEVATSTHVYYSGSICTRYLFDEIIPEATNKIKQCFFYSTFKKKTSYFINFPIV